jgi:hypothetical protein
MESRSTAQFFPVGRDGRGHTALLLARRLWQTL